MLPIAELSRSIGHGIGVEEGFPRCVLLLISSVVNAIDAFYGIVLGSISAAATTVKVVWEMLRLRF